MNEDNASLGKYRTLYEYLLALLGTNIIIPFSQCTFGDFPFPKGDMDSFPGEYHPHNLLFDDQA